MPIRRGRFAPQNTFLETIAQKFDHGNSNFVLGSAQEKNNYPIVYCSDGFCELTGFSRSELMRRSCACNFLYGLETNQDHIHNIQNALGIQQELKKEVLFYKKNGSPFFCLLDIVPIKNEKGNVVLFLVSHKDVTKRKLSNEVNFDDSSTSVKGGTGDRKLTRSRSRKFSRDVLLHLSRQYQTNNASKPHARRPVKRSRSFSFNSERLPLYKRETTKKSKLLFLHYSNVKGLWDWWVLILTFYIAIMVPYNVAFSRNGKARDLIIVDMVIELFFILDIVVHFRTTYVNNAGRIVYDQKAIAIHYLKGWFILDFLAALPFEALYFINQSWDSSPFDSQGSAYKEGFLVQLLKCGRLLRLFRVVRKLHRYTEYSTVLLTLLMLAFAMVAHWLACVWYVIGLEEVHANSTISWLYQFGDTIQMPFINFSPDTGPDEGSAYVTALYFTLTSMTTVGFGNVSANTNAEKAFSVVVMLIGALMHAAIFGNVAAIIQKLYANRVRYHSRSNEIKQFIRVHHIEPDLANRLEDYFHTTWSLSGGVDTREILTTFPSELQADVCMHLYKGLLELPVFAQAPRGLYRMLSLQITPVLMGPGEYLLTQNDVINTIYYIASGSMEVLQGESVAAILGKGDLFGEDISRKIPIRRSNGDVRALTYCDVYYITRDRLQEVLHLYPDFSYKISDKLELTYDLGASERDIWRRGGLDSISEDEEEEEEDEAESPETDQDNLASSPARNRFDFNSKFSLPLHRRTNNFKPNEAWSTYSRVHIKRPSSLNISGRRSIIAEEQPLLARPSNDYHDNHLGNQGNETTEEQPKSDSRLQAPDVLSDPSLEWEQESFPLKKEDIEEEDCPELNHVIVDRIESPIDEAAFVETDMGCESLRNMSNSFTRDSDSSLRFDRESFLKQLHLSADEAESENDTKRSPSKENVDARFNFEDSTLQVPIDDGVESELDAGEFETGDLMEFTEFSNSTDSPRRSRRARFQRSPALSTPACLLPRDRSVSPVSSYTGSLKNYMEGIHSREDMVGTNATNAEEIRSPRMQRRTGCASPSPSNESCRRDHPAMGQRRDTLDLTPVETGRVSPRRKRSISPLPESPYVSMRRLFSQSPVQRSPCGSINHDSIEESFEDDDPERISNKAPSYTRNPLRRGYTDGTALTEERSKPERRGRKMSAVMQPPSIFATLVAQAHSPYADFVPPNILRESSITCNCGENESCPSCNGRNDHLTTDNGTNECGTYNHGETGDRTYDPGTTDQINNDVAYHGSSAEDCDSNSVAAFESVITRNGSSSESLRRIPNPSGDAFGSTSDSSTTSYGSRKETDYNTGSPSSNSTSSLSSSSGNAKNNYEGYGLNDDSSLAVRTKFEQVVSLTDVQETEMNNNLSRSMPLEELSSSGSILKTLRALYDDNTDDGEPKYDSKKELSLDLTLQNGASSAQSGSPSVSVDQRQRPLGKNSFGEVTDGVAMASEDRRELRRLTITPDGVRYHVSDDFLSPEHDVLPGNESQFELVNTKSLGRSRESLDGTCETLCSSGRKTRHDRPDSTYIPPFFDEVTSNEYFELDPRVFLYGNNTNNVLNQKSNASSISQSSFTPVSPIGSQRKDTPSSSSTSVRTSAMSLENISTDDLPQRYKESLSMHPVRKPTLSGIHSVYSLQSLPGNDHVGEGLQRRPMRSSFSEPHLTARFFQNEPIESLNEEYNDVQLEEIFKDVASTKEAMERLQLILKSPEPDLCSELADTKETVKRLDRQVLHLNEDVASLSKDIKTVLELLKGLKNGQVDPTL